MHPVVLKGQDRYATFRDIKAHKRRSVTMLQPKAGPGVAAMIRCRQPRQKGSMAGIGWEGGCSPPCDAGILFLRFADEVEFLGSMLSAAYALCRL
jgi:hypothetical protein